MGHAATFAFDADNNLTSTTDRNGRVRNLSYDAFNRQTGETWVVSGTTVNTLTFTYDAADNRLTAGEAQGTYTMAYDALNRMTSQTGLFGVTLTFAYDAGNNRTQVQDSLGGTTTSVYDALHRLTSRQFGGTGQTPLRIDFTYTPRDQIASETRYSDLAGTQKIGSTSFTYDAQQRLTNLQHLNGIGGNLANYTYAYDLGDRLTQETLNGTTKTYSYDVTNQLTNDSAATYTYDNNGNRTMTGYSTGTGNQLTSDGTWNYTYDNEGNQVTKTKISTSEKWTFGYDTNNRLVSAVDANSVGTTLATDYLAYDVFGNRIEQDTWTQSSGTTVTRFTYDGLNVLADLTSGNAVQTRYVRGDAPNQFIARISSSGTVAWYLTDRLGSVRDLTDNTGAPQDHIDYDGFGNATSETHPAFGGRFKFQGMEFQVVIGLYGTWARFYDPGTGRWTSQDPSGFAALDANLYRYVANDPTNHTDPSGLRSPKDLIGLTPKPGFSGPPPRQLPISPPGPPDWSFPGPPNWSVPGEHKLVAGRDHVYLMSRPAMCDCGCGCCDCGGYFIPWWSPIYLPHWFVLVEKGDGTKVTYDYDGSWHTNNSSVADYTGMYWLKQWWPGLSGADVQQAYLQIKDDTGEDLINNCQTEAYKLLLRASQVAGVEEAPWVYIDGTDQKGRVVRAMP